MATTMRTTSVYLPLATQAALARDPERCRALLERVNVQRVLWHDRWLLTPCGTYHRAYETYAHWNNLLELLNRLLRVRTPLHPDDGVPGHPLLELGFALGRMFYRDLATDAVLFSWGDFYGSAGSTRSQHFHLVRCTWAQWLHGYVAREFGAMTDPNGYVVGRDENLVSAAASERVLRNLRERAVAR